MSLSVIQVSSRKNSLLRLQAGGGEEGQLCTVHTSKPLPYSPVDARMDALLDSRKAKLKSIELVIEGAPVLGLVDCGATCSVVHHDLVRKVNTPLRGCRLRLSSVFGTCLQPLGRKMIPLSIPGTGAGCRLHSLQGR